MVASWHQELLLTQITRTFVTPQTQVSDCLDLAPYGLGFQLRLGRSGSRIRIPASMSCMCPFASRQAFFACYLSECLWNWDCGPFCHQGAHYCSNKVRPCLKSVSTSNPHHTPSWLDISLEYAPLQTHACFLFLGPWDSRIGRRHCSFGLQHRGQVSTLHWSACCAHVISRWRPSLQ